MLRKLFSRPAWKHRDENIRAEAVAQLKDPALVAELERIAELDVSHKVRIAALRRLSDPDALEHIRQSDSHQEVRKAARKQLLDTLTLNSKTEDQAFIDQCTDAELIEDLLARTESLEGREALAKKLDKVAIYRDLALASHQHHERMHWLKFIDAPGILEKLAESFRKKDKKAYRHIQQKLLDAKIRAGDRDAADQLTAELCQEMEKTISTLAPDKLKNALALWQQKWQETGQHASEAMTRRFQGSVNLAINTLAAHDPETRKVVQNRLQAEKSGELEELRVLLDQIQRSTYARLDKLEAELVAWNKRWQALAPLDDTSRETKTTEMAKQLRNACEQALAKLREQAPLGPETRRFLKQLEKSEHKPAGKLHSNQLMDMEQELIHLESKQSKLPEQERKILASAHNRLKALTDKLANNHQQQEKDLAALPAMLHELENLLEQNDLKKADIKLSACQQAWENCKTLPASRQSDLSSRLYLAGQSLRELKNWLNWSNNEIRERLCEELEALQGQGLHPDAISERLRQARQQWKKLEESERLPGNRRKYSAPASLWHRFQDACKALHEPASKYFEKRADLQKQHLDQAARDIDQLATLAQKETVDWRELQSAIRKAAGILRNLDRFPPAKRGDIAATCKKSLESANRRMEQHHAGIIEDKQRLIEKMKPLASMENLSDAAAQARELQKKWQDLEHLPRHREQKLWKEFRQYCDPVFEQLNEKKKQQHEETREQLSHGDSILDEIENMLAKPASNSEYKSEFHRLEKELLALEMLGREQKNRLEELRHRLSDTLDKLEQDAEEQKLATLQKVANALQQLEECVYAESPDEIRKANIAKLESLDIEREQLPLAMQERWQAALAENESAEERTRKSTAAREQAEYLCVAMEFLTGTKTPEAFHQQRMDYQVERLSSRLGGQEEQAKPSEQYRDLQLKWLATGPLEPEQRKTLEQRFQAARKAFRN